MRSLAPSIVAEFEKKPTRLGPKSDFLLPWEIGCVAWERVKTCKSVCHTAKPWELVVLVKSITQYHHGTCTRVSTSAGWLPRSASALGCGRRLWRGTVDPFPPPSRTGRLARAHRARAPAVGRPANYLNYPAATFNASEQLWHKVIVMLTHGEYFFLKEKLNSHERTELAAY